MLKKYKHHSFDYEYFYTIVKRNASYLIHWTKLSRRLHKSGEKNGLNTIYWGKAGVAFYIYQRDVGLMYSSVKRTHNYHLKDMKNYSEET